MKSSELHRLLKVDGWIEIRQKGSHIILIHPIKIGSLSVPFHGNKEVSKGLLQTKSKYKNG